jgi:hypothetical protein
MVMSVIWSACSFNFFLVFFLTKYLPGNIFVNGMVSTGSGIAAYAFAGVIYKMAGLKRSIILTMSIAALGGVSILAYQITTKRDMKHHSDLTFPVLFLLANFGVCSTFSTVFLSAADETLFPRLFAGSAFGICNFLARTATLFAPLVAEMEGLTPMMIYTSLSLVSLLASVFLPLQVNE